MAEVSEKFKITLRIGTMSFPVTIARETEEVYRMAEKLINERLNHYSSRFPSQTKENYMAMTMIELALSVKSNEVRNDTKPYEESIKKWLHEIDKVLSTKK